MLQNRTRLGSAVDKETFEQLRKLSKSTRIPISRLLDEAIEDLLKKFQENSIINSRVL